jgi:hypothetical protein
MLGVLTPDGLLNPTSLCPWQTGSQCGKRQTQVLMSSIKRESAMRTCNNNRQHVVGNNNLLLLSGSLRIQLGREGTSQDHLRELAGQWLCLLTQSSITLKITCGGCALKEPTTASASTRRLFISLLGMHTVKNEALKKRPIKKCGGPGSHDQASRAREATHAAYGGDGSPRGSYRLAPSAYIMHTANSQMRHSGCLLLLL